MSVEKDVQAVVTCLCALCEHVGAEYFHVVLISPTSQQCPDVQFLTSCPERWLDTYYGNGFFAVDPVVIKGMSQSAPIMWANIISECCEKSNFTGLDVMMKARDAGLHDGITIPWHGPNGHVGQLSLITLTARTERQWFNSTLVSSWLSNYIFEALICSSWLPCTHSARLSARELEVCHWAAEGKQSGDIAMILGVTPRTISFHFERIVEKLGASSKNQALFKVIKQGLIKLNIASARVRKIDIRWTQPPSLACLPKISQPIFFDGEKQGGLRKNT
ncbi:autoinducer binding domain-containing protein [Aeromonas veronii]